MDNADIVELRGQIKTLHERMKEVHDRAKKEKRSALPEEETEFDRLNAEMDGLEKRVAREERLKGIGDGMKRHLRPHEVAHQTTIDPEERGKGQGEQSACPRMSEIRSMLMGRIPAGEEIKFSDIHPEILSKGANVLRQYRAKRHGRNVGRASAAEMGERRNLNASDFEAGGSLIPDQQFETQLLAAVDDQLFMRGLATVKTLRNAKSLGVPRRTARASDAEWTTELDTGSDDTALKFGLREFRAHPVAKRVRVSRTEMAESPMNPESIVIRELSYIMALTGEKAHVTGDGNKRPLGVFTVDDKGIGSDRDITSSKSLDITADDLIDVQSNVKPQYRNRGWMYHRLMNAKIRKLKDANGVYVWTPGLMLGQASMLLGEPIYLCENAPLAKTSVNFDTAGVPVICYGDFSWYWIIDTLDMTVLRLVERYAESNEIGFIFRYEGDGGPAQPEAFSRLKLKA